MEGKECNKFVGRGLSLLFDGADFKGCSCEKPNQGNFDTAATRAKLYHSGHKHRGSLPNIEDVFLKGDILGCVITGTL